MWFLPAAAGVRPGVRIACQTWGRAAASRAAEGGALCPPTLTPSSTRGPARPVGLPASQGGSFAALRAKLSVPAQNGSLRFATLGPSAKGHVKGGLAPRSPRAPLASSS